MKISEIESEKQLQIEHERTECTGERSQFWQKIIPWRKDEQEESK